MDKYSHHGKTLLWLWLVFGLYGAWAAEERTVRLPAVEVSEKTETEAQNVAVTFPVTPKKELPHHRSKRTLTTICVEIKPSGPLEEPYYMCKGENFGDENKQSCVEFKPGGAHGELYYMCKGNDFAAGTGQPEQPAPYGFPHPKQAPAAAAPTYQPQAAPIAHTFPSFPVFGGGLFPGQQQHEEPRRETPTTTYQEQRPQQEEFQKPQQQPQNAPQQQLQYAERPPQQSFNAQQQPHNPPQQFGHPGGSVATPAAASAAQSYGLPAVLRPNPGSPSALQYGGNAGAGPTATPTAYNSAAAPKSAAATKATQAQGQQYKTPPVVGSRHQPGLDADVLGVPRVGFQPEEFRQQYRGGMAEPPMQQRQQQQQQQQDLPEPQMVWLPPAPVGDPHDDPVMRSFYSSLAPQQIEGVAAGPTIGAAPTVGAAVGPTLGAAAQRTPLRTMRPAEPNEPLVGQSYQPFYGQAAEPQTPPTLPPPPPAYTRPELPPSNLESAPAAYNSYCNGCNSPFVPRQCPGDTGVSYSTVCPSFQPVIIAMPCYEQQPTHYLALPNRVASSCGNEMPGPSPYGSSYGVNQQVASPYGMAQQMGSAYGANQQVGSPFGAQQQVGSPFGANQQGGSPFGANQQIGSPFRTNQQSGSPFGSNQQGGSPFGAQQQVGSPFGANQQVANQFGANQLVGSPFGGNQQGASPFGANQQVGNPFGSTAQVGNPFGMAPQMTNNPNPGFNMNMGAQVGSPFGLAGPQVGAGFGMGLNPFGPFGSLNPFNPFNRILGAAAPTTPQPHKNGFQRIFQFDSSTTAPTTTEAPTVGSTLQQSTEKSGKLNFSSSTPTAAPSTALSEPSLGAALSAPADEDEHEEEEDEEEDEDHVETTPAASSEADASVGASLESIPLGKLTAKDLMNKAEESLKSDEQGNTESSLKAEKRKRHNSRLNKGINQKRKYLQQL
ncbi:trithorax group protein osa [Drosophila subobscura]|uniref:trithorax group protein osa n=1 Tax=Drosophila subobscura TaxID=7241 RepID=UPI00155B13C8|nr:trithorax group protein osa [Drosophila subobscura]XP_034668602.1 trithorax group protein osa [Drosophila subobscura]